jgi:Ca-activated chloride channel homolog
MTYRSFALFLALIVFLSAASFSQTQNKWSGDRFRETYNRTVPLGPELFLRKQVNEVSLLVSVTDKKGHFISGLSPDKFSVFDNNQQERNFTFFQNQTDLPLDIAIVLDTSESVTARYEAERNSITQFIQQTIKHADAVTLFAFNDAVRVIAPINYNWRNLSKRLKHIKPQGNTALYDAVTSAAERLSDNDRPARRIIIVVSDGEENQSRGTLDETIAAVTKAEAVVYSVNDGDDVDTDPGKQGETVLTTLAQSTGGAYFHASEDGEIGSAFSKIRKELRSQYALAYKPSDLSVAGFHALKVLVGNLKVRCRRGYYVEQGLNQAIVSKARVR